jgi:hypothetical protein
MEQEQKTPSATCVDLTGQTPLIAPEIMRQVMENTPAAWEKQPDPSGTSRPTQPLVRRSMKGKSYGAAFASDMPRERIDFDVEGQPGWVVLRKMGSGPAEDFQTLGIEFPCDAAGNILEGNTRCVDLRKRHVFLVSHTVQECSIPKRTATGWTTIVLPALPSQVPDFIASQFDLNPELWEDLLQECYRVNGLTDSDQGNS